MEFLGENDAKVGISWKLGISYYGVCYNGQLSSEGQWQPRKFIPERGLRQGDRVPLPLPFVCWSVLSSIEKGWRWWFTCRSKNLSWCTKHITPIVRQRLLILFRANEGDCRHLQFILQLYEDCSGQMINKAKSAVLFSKNTTPENKKLVCNLLQVTKETMNERYLGLLVHVGKSKINISPI